MLITPGLPVFNSSMLEGNVAIINEVAIGIEQSDEDTQQLTIANEQITSTMQDVSGAALELANIANDLQVLVGKTRRPYASLTYEARVKGGDYWRTTISFW